MEQTLYVQLVSAGCKIDNHESDLYVMGTSDAVEIVRKWKSDVGLGSTASSMFISEIDGMQWIEIPFQFQPFWKPTP